MTTKESPVLAVLPRMPSRGDASARLLAALARGGRPVDVVAAAPAASEEHALRRLGAASAPEAPDALGARAREACARRTYAAVVVVDAAATRACGGMLAQYARRPVVLVQLEPEPARVEGEFLQSHRAREQARRGLCSAAEVWSFEDGPAGPPTATRARPRIFMRRERLDGAWVASRLKAVAAGKAEPPEKGLASIIIPCWNNLADTKECLRAIESRSDAPHEIIVVDNGSTDGTAEWVRRNSSARVIRNAENLGFARAVNQGMRAAKGRWLIWHNNDVVVTPGWLSRLTAAAARSPWMGAVGPCTNRTVGSQLVAGAPDKDDAGLAVFSTAWALKHEGRVRGVHRLTGFCLLVRREAYEQCGGLDERFGLGTYEEYDYCLRLRQAGWDLAVAEDCFVLHHGSRTFGSEERMRRRSAANRDLFIDKWCRCSLEFLDEVDPDMARRARRSGHGRGPGRGGQS